MMYLAIAVEAKKHPSQRCQYRVWYLELDKLSNVIGIGVKSREELLQSLMGHYKRYGESKWRAFLKDREESSPIELLDFISWNMHENTHFGELPSLQEFQHTLDALHTQLEVRSHAI